MQSFLHSRESSVVLSWAPPANESSASAARSRRSPRLCAAASPLTHWSCITGQAIPLDLLDLSMQIFSTCQQQPHVCTQAHIQVRLHQHMHTGPGLIACALYPSAGSTPELLLPMATLPGHCRRVSGVHPVRSHSPALAPRTVAPTAMAI